MVESSSPLEMIVLEGMAIANYVIDIADGKIPHWQCDAINVPQNVRFACSHTFIFTWFKRFWRVTESLRNFLPLLSHSRRMKGLISKVRDRIGASVFDFMSAPTCICDPGTVA